MDHFADDGATKPMHGNATHPAGFQGAGLTWTAWEAYGATGRAVHCTVLDHAGNVFGPVHKVADQPLHSDSHGVPAICMDHQGYVHCFHGPHDGDLLIHSTAHPGDPAQWIARGVLAAGDYTYPKPVPIGGAIHLILRKRIAAQTRRTLVLLKTTSLADGVPVFGGEQPIVDFGPDSRVYAGAVHPVGPDLHISATWADYADSVRRHVYHFVYDALTGSVRNADGSVVVMAGALPITLAQANADFRVVDFGTDRGDMPGFCIGADGALHLAYARGTAGAFGLYHAMLAGGAWSTVLVGAIPGTDHATFTDSITLVPQPDGRVELWYPYDPGGIWTQGGDMVRRIFDGSWGPQELVRAAGSKALGRPTAIRDAHADGRVVFTEVAQSDADSAAGGLRLFLHGDSGLIGRADPPPSVVLQIDSAGGGASHRASMAIR